jgi:hypothetical protein
MSELINTKIYKDCRGLRKTLRKASFHACKSDRIAYITPLIKLTGELIKEFGLSYGLPYDKATHAENFLGIFYIVKSDVIELFEENIIKSSKQTIVPNDNNHNENLNEIKVNLEGYITRIQEGINRWLTSMAKVEGKITCE